MPKMCHDFLHDFRLKIGGYHRVSPRRNSGVEERARLEYLQSRFEVGSGPEHLRYAAEHRATAAIN
jgi:hypothetical protein